MASTSSEEGEEKIMKAYATRKRQHSDEMCSGIVMNLYQLRDDKRKKWKHGDIFHATRKEALIFGKERIEAASLDNRRDSRFLIEELSEQSNVEDRMVRALRVRHMGILKLRMVSYNPQISKMVSGYGICDNTLVEWLNKQPVSQNEYLTTHQKEMLRTVYLVIDYMWTKGLSSDVLDDPNSYVMLDTRIRILDSCFRPKNENETMMTLRNGFATMILQLLLPKWLDEEIRDFVDLVRNPNASKKDILGHPILLSPTQRELLYHEFDGAPLSDFQRRLVNQIRVPPNWQRIVKGADPVVNKIFEYQIEVKEAAIQIHKQQVFSFSKDVAGAIHLGAVMSAHYVQHARGHYKKWWTNYVEADTVDKLLKVFLPRMLTRRYGMAFDNRFRGRGR